MSLLVLFHLVLALAEAPLFFAVIKVILKRKCYFLIRVLRLTVFSV